MIFATGGKPWGSLIFEVGYHPNKKIHVIRVVFRTRRCTCLHCLGVQNWKKGCVFEIFTNFGKDIMEKLRRVQAKTCN